jgi:hypothetical protein
MTIHQERTHPVPQPDCFACRIGTINWGIVPGAFKDLNSDALVDKDAILDAVGHRDGRGSAFNKERIEDARSDVMARTRDFFDAAR